MRPRSLSSSRRPRGRTRDPGPRWPARPASRAGRRGERRRVPRPAGHGAGRRRRRCHPPAQPRRRRRPVSDPAALGDAANGRGGRRSGETPARGPPLRPGRLDRDAVREDTQGAPRDGLLWVPDAAADALSDEHWWKGFLGVAAAFAAHSRTVSRSLFDHVTGLPDRAEFQAELEVALARAQETRRPAGAPSARPGRLRLGQRAARPALRGPRAPGDRGRDPGRAPEPRSRRALRRRHLHRHPPRHAGRRQPDRRGERRAAVERPAIPRRASCGWSSAPAWRRPTRRSRSTRTS